LNCLAANTGGSYTTARDAGSLKKALEKTVVEVKKKVAAPVSVKPKTDPGVKVIATYKQNGPEFKGDINWYVLEPEADISGKRKQIAEKHRGKSGHIFQDLPPGKHVFVAQLSDHGHIRREFEIEVSVGQAVTHELVLNIGTVRFDAFLKEGGEPYQWDLGWKVLSPQKDLSGKHPQLADFWRKRSGSIFILPAGQWLISGVIADHKHVGYQTKEIKVEPAGEEAHSFVFNAGTVRFDALLKEGGEPYQWDLGWNVLSPKKDLSGKHQQLTDFWRKRSGSIFILPAGQWLITGVMADWKYIGTRKEITVEPGGEEAHTFVFNAGAVRFDAFLKEGGEPYQWDLGWNVLSPKKDLSGKHQQLTDFWRKRSGQVFMLPAGEWIVPAVLADHKHVATQNQFLINAGDTLIQNFVFNAGSAKIEATLEGAPWAGQLGWEIFGTTADLAGNRPKITNAWRVKSGKVTILPTGEYVVVAVNPDNKKIRGETTFRIAAGDEKSVQVDLKKP